MTTTSVTSATAPGTYTETSGNTLLVESGGSVSQATVDGGGSLVVSGGVDMSATISSGGTEIVSKGSASGDIIYGSAFVSSGGTVTSESLQSGGFLFVSSGGIDSATIISAGANETEFGSAFGDQIYGTQLVSGTTTSNAVVTSETVFSGGNLDLFLKGTTASATVVSSGGSFTISGAAFASNTTLSGGGSLVVESAKATLAGSLTFAGGSNTLVISSVASNTTVGDLAAISGFSSTDKIDVSLLGASVGSAGLSFASSGGNETVTVSGTGGSQTFIFAGTASYTSATLAIVSSGGHEYVEYSASGFSSSGGNSTSVTTPTGSGAYTETSGQTLYVLNGGSVSAPTIQNGAFLVVNGGADTSAIISSGGSETVSAGSATKDSIFGGASVISGATVTSETVQGGGLLIVNSGGTDSATIISAGGNETEFGSAFGDQIFGTQLVTGTTSSTAVVTSETVFNGGNLDLYLKGAVASGTIVSSGGSLNINGNAFASNTILSGSGILDLESPKAVVTGTLTFAGGGNTLLIADTTSATYGDLAVNSGFSSTDTIDLTSAAYVGSALTLSQTVTSGNLVVSVLSSGMSVETFTFAGTTLSGALALESDGNGGEDLATIPTSVTTSVTTSTTSAYTENATDTLLVLNGGSVSGATIESGGFLVVNGGSDTAATISSGGSETVSTGSATGDQIFGSTTLSGGAVSNETVLSGGVLTIGATSASNVVLSAGGIVALASATAELTGTLTFSGGDNTLDVTVLSTSGFGAQAAISGFSTNDKIDVTGISPTSATLTFAPNGSGGDVATITGTGGSESFTFANATTYNSSTMSLVSDGSGGVDLILDTTPVVAFTSLGGTTNLATQIVNGTVNTGLDPEAVGTTVSVTEGNTVVGTATVGANGYWSANVTFLNDDGANVLTASDTDSAGNKGTSQSLTYNVNTGAAAFTAGNLVISISGDGDGSGSYGDNQASPITLEQLTTSGTYVGQLVLPETTTMVNGVTEYNISGEYGSSSEGTLELSGDGHSLVIAGYGVNDVTYNTGGAAVYGNAAEAQSTSVPGGQYTAVSRVIADINASGTVDTSTALYNVFNTNNPRSVATINGTSFYIAGQGVSGDTTQGVFVAQDGASNATSIDTSTDARTVEIYDGQLYVSRDSKQPSGTGTSNVSTYGGSLPTSATTPAVLTGINQSVTLSAGNGNSINNSTGTVDLSPENYYFANSTTLYIADGGDPKEGTAGDGGLQKWSLVNGSWTLDYTLTSGLNLIDNPSISGDTSGTTGLIGLTGEVVGGQVELFATNSTIADLDQTYLYGITDTLSDTTASQASGESFTVLATAAADTNIRGVAFAPTVATVTSGQTVTIAAGQSADTDTVLSGGILFVSGTTSATLVSAGGAEFVFSGGADSATSVDGAEVVSSGGTASGMILASGGGAFIYGSAVSASIGSGAFLLVSSGGTARATTVSAGGQLLILGTASATTVSGGTITVSAGGSDSGTLVAAGAEVVSSGGVASGMMIASGAGAFDYGSTQSATVSAGAFMIVEASGSASTTTLFGGNVFVDGIASGTIVSAGAETVSSGGTDLGATLSGGAFVLSSGGLSENLTVDTGAGAFVYGSMTSATISSGAFVVVETMGSATTTTLSGGNLFVDGTASGTFVSTGAETVSSGGTDVGATLSGGAFVLSSGGLSENLTVDAGAGAFIYGSATGATASSGGFVLVQSGGVATGAAVASGGSLQIAGTDTGSIVQAGGREVISSGGVDGGTTLSGGIEVVSSGGTLNGTVTFAGGGLLALTDPSNFGAGALVAGFSTPSDILDFRNISFAAGPTVGFTEAGNNQSGTLSVAAGGITDTLTLIGQYSVANFTSGADAVGGTTIIDPPITTSALVTQPQHA